MRQNLKATRQTGSKNENHPCIWAQAEVVSKKNCNNYYDCSSCKYDAAMGANAQAGKHMSWQDALRKKDSKERVCRHALTRRAEHRSCPMNYNCFKCGFDQMFEDTLVPGTGHASLEMRDIKGFKIPSGFYFHSGHTWASLDSGGFIRVGMDDFAFKVLGGPSGFDLPLIGQELSFNKIGWGIKQGQNVGDVRSPVNGVITKVNYQVNRSPNLPVQKPYEDGWLFTVHNRDLKGEIKALMDDESGEKWLDSEVGVLEKMIEGVAGPLSADGGYLISDVYSHLPALGWNNLTRTFLRT